MRAALLLLVAAAPARAAFEDLGAGARALGMGGAYTAVADEPFGLFYNPAGIALERRGSFAGSLEGAHQSPFGAYETDRSVGAGLLPLTLDGQGGTLGVLARVTEAAGVVRDREAGLSLARRGLAGGFWGRLDGGVTLRALNRSAAGDSRSVLSGDAGFLVRRGVHALGVSVLNIGQPDLTAGGVKDRAASAVKVGLAQKSAGLVLAADLTHRASSAAGPANYTAAVGGERTFSFARGRLAARLGLASGNEARTAAAGLGWRALGVEASYAVSVPLDEDVPAGHAVTLGVRFGQPDALGEYERLLQLELDNQKQLAGAVRKLESRVAELAAQLESERAEAAALRERLDAAERKAAEAAKGAKAKEPDAEEVRRLKEALERSKGEAERIARRKLEADYEKDWAEYLRLKSTGAPKEALRSALERVIIAYKDKGLDLSGARQELVRLLKE